MHEVERKIHELIREHGGHLTRTKKHNVYRFPDGRTYTMAQTPSDVRAAMNQLSDLKRLLGLTESSPKYTDDLNLQREVKAEQQARAQREAEQQSQRARSLQAYREMVLDKPQPKPFINMKEVARPWTLGSTPIPIRRDRFRKTYQYIQHGAPRTYPQHVIDQVNWMRKMGAPETEIAAYMADSTKQENNTMPNYDTNIGLSAASIDAYIAQLKTGISYMNQQLVLAEKMREGFASVRPFLATTGAPSVKHQPTKSASTDKGPRKTNTYPYPLTRKIVEVLNMAGRALSWNEIEQAVTADQGFKNAPPASLKASIYNQKEWFNQPARGVIELTEAGRQSLTTPVANGVQPQSQPAVV